MASQFFNSMLPQVDPDFIEDIETPLVIDETLVLTDTRDPSETITQLSFKFNKPIPAGKVTKSQLLGALSELVQDGSLEIAERILSHMGLSEARPAVNKSKTTKIQLGKASRYRKGRSTGLRDGKGRFISEINLRNAIQLAATNALVKDMKKNKSIASKDTGLKFQTGRFANSMKLKPLTLKKDGTLSIFYTYMVKPYQVFDPQISNKPSLATAKRNPQYMIGNAISEALKQLGLSRYNVEIKQHRR